MKGTEAKTFDVAGTRPSNKFLTKGRIAKQFSMRVLKPITRRVPRALTRQAIFACIDAALGEVRHHQLWSYQGEGKGC